jgi:Na+-transporting methylmalonyl-CoA/oxaloacetate decarboxylase gamma subunit
VGNTINFSETLIFALGGIAIVLAILILYAISLVAKLSKTIIEAQQGSSVEHKPAQSVANNNAAPQNYVQSFDDGDDEEDRLVVALAASAIAASNKPDSQFHITKITRIK